MREDEKRFAYAINLILIAFHVVLQAYALLIVKDETRGVSGVKECLEDWERRRGAGGGEAGEKDIGVVELVRGMLLKNGAA